MVTFCVRLCVCVWEKGSLSFPWNKGDIDDDDNDDGDLQPRLQLRSWQMKTSESKRNRVTRPPSWIFSVMCQPARGTKRSAVSASQWWIVSRDECQISCSLWVRVLLWRRLVGALFVLTETHTQASLPLIMKASYTQRKLTGSSFLESKTELHLQILGLIQMIHCRQTLEIWLNSLFYHDVTSSPHSAVVYPDVPISLFYRKMLQLKTWHAIWNIFYFQVYVWERAHRKYLKGDLISSSLILKLAVTSSSSQSSSVDFRASLQLSLPAFVTNKSAQIVPSLLRPAKNVLDWNLDRVMCQISHLKSQRHSCVCKMFLTRQWLRSKLQPHQHPATIKSIT